MRSRSSASLALVFALLIAAAPEAEARQSAIRLIPAPAELEQACATAARRFHVDIYCPKRTPAGWSIASVCVGCHGLRLFSATGWFPAPRGYVGQPGEPTGHLNVWAASRRLFRLGYVGCPDAVRSWRRRIAGRSTTWLVCPQDSTLDSGHVVVQWSAPGWVYGLTLHSNTTTNRHLLAAMARYLVRVRE